MTPFLFVVVAKEIGQQEPPTQAEEKNHIFVVAVKRNWATRTTYISGGEKPPAHIRKEPAWDRTKQREKLSLCSQACLPFESCNNKTNLSPNDEIQA